MAIGRKVRLVGEEREASVGNDSGEIALVVNSVPRDNPVRLTRNAFLRST